MFDRLLERGETSGREDDNIESIKKRLSTYRRNNIWLLLSLILSHRNIQRDVDTGDQLLFKAGKND